MTRALGLFVAIGSVSVAAARVALPQRAGLGEGRLADAEPVRFAGDTGFQLDDLYVDPHERFLIGAIVRTGRGPQRTADLVICFRQADGAWGEPRLLNDRVNTDRFERFPGLSPDGRYLFFLRSSAPGSFTGARYYWVSTEKLGIPGAAPSQRTGSDRTIGVGPFVGRPAPALGQ